MYNAESNGVENGKRDGNYCLGSVFWSLSFEAYGSRVRGVWFKLHRIKLQASGFLGLGFRDRCVDCSAQGAILTSADKHWFHADSFLLQPYVARFGNPVP